MSPKTESFRLLVGTPQYAMRLARDTGEIHAAQALRFDVFEPLRRVLVEPGRACVHRRHRNPAAPRLLWKGIAGYCRQHGARYLLGCSSITSQDPTVGAAVYTRLCRKYLSPLPWRTRPRPAFDCPLSHLTEEEPSIPKLLRACLGLGATICETTSAGPYF